MARNEEIAAELRRIADESKAANDAGAANVRERLRAEADKISGGER